MTDIKTSFQFEFSKNTVSPKIWSDEPGFIPMVLMLKQNFANDKLKVQGHLFLNEVLDILGLARVREGQDAGWTFMKYQSGQSYVNFGVYPTNNVNEMSGFTKDSSLDRIAILTFNCIPDIRDIVWPGKKNRA